LPEEKDPVRLIALYEADWELEKKITSIMENADQLKGKEYIDFLLEFL